MVVAKSDIAVLFYAGWCPDCSRFMPIFDAAAAKAALLAAEPEMMRGVQGGVLHKNTASRKVSRLSARVKALGRPA